MSDDNQPLILTRGDRLARALREDLNLAERAAGRSVWQTPNVRSLRQWIADSWADSWPAEQLLDATQMQALWLAAVERDRHGVVSASTCAREARAAEQLAQDWRIPLDDGAASFISRSDEQRAWRGWRRRVAERMREHHWISTEHLPGLVAEGLRAGRIVPPPRIELAGFASGATPAEREVLDALAAVSRVSPRGTARTQSRPPQGLRVEDAAAQVRLAAEFVRMRLADSAREASLPPRILIALPEPDAARAALEDALIEYVAPALRSADEAARAPWRWDAAESLSASPWAAAMQAVLAVDAHDNAPDASSSLLLGAWRHEPATQAAAAQLDHAQRRAGRLRIRLRALADAAAPPLRDALTALTGVVEQAPRRALPSAWSEHFAARLAAAGWPGLAALPSNAFQAVGELRRTLAQLGALDAQLGAVDVGRARYWLGELLKRRFGPRAGHVQPVQIVSVEDARDLPCDLLLVLDADAAPFPGPARATPFLPIERQRAAGVPQASPARWLTQARADAAALLAGAREAIVIAPLVDARGGDVLPSPLFDVAWSTAPATRVKSRGDRLAAQAPIARLPASDPVPAVAAAEQLHGNTRLLEQYAAAPFLAFAAQRLGIEALPQVGRGLPAQLQGMAIHAALKRFWDATHTAAALRSLTPAQRRTRIEAAVRDSLRELLPEADYGRVLVRLEAARLTDVLGAWLALEAERAEDFSVIAHEQGLAADLAGLPFTLRIDRVEAATDTGDHTLIDYKTGAQIDANGWREEALSAPQLPLYAVLLDDAAIADIAFGHVHDGAPELLRWQQWSQGRRRPPVLHAGDFAGQRAAWRAALAASVAGFLAGRADLSAEQAAALRDEPLLALANLLADEDLAAETGE